MNCTECGKEVCSERYVQVDDKTFCNNLCKLIWSRKNPGAVTPTTPWSHAHRNGEPAESRAPLSSTKRIVWGTVWFILLYLLATLVSSIVVGSIAAKQNPADQTGAARIAAESFVKSNGIYLLGGAALLAILCTFGGILPGTGRWKRGKSLPKGMAYRPFGPFASFFLSLALMLLPAVPIAIWAGVTAYRTKMADTGLSAESIKMAIENSGTLVTNSILLSFAIIFPAIILLMLVKGRRNFLDYCAFRPVPWPKLLMWIGIALAILLLLASVSWLLHKPIIPEKMLQQYAATRYVWLLGLGMILLAPLYEELLFRSFLFISFLKSSLGPIGAVMLTGLFWSIMHLQYDAAQIFGIFLLGISLGLARLNTNSIITPFLMHVFWNTAVFGTTAYLALKTTS